jgi:hypothetical protein
MTYDTNGTHAKGQRAWLKVVMKDGEPWKIPQIIEAIQDKGGPLYVATSVTARLRQMKYSEPDCKVVSEQVSRYTWTYRLVRKPGQMELGL